MHVLLTSTYNLDRPQTILLRPILAAQQIGSESMFDTSIKEGAWPVGHDSKHTTNYAAITEVCIDKRLHENKIKR
jgi:hypothetical protein